MITRLEGCNCTHKSQFSTYLLKLCFSSDFAQEKETNVKCRLLMLNAKLCVLKRVINEKFANDIKQFE